MLWHMKLVLFALAYFDPKNPILRYTVRPRDTRPRAARTSQKHVFELGPKKFEMNEFMK